LRVLNRSRIGSWPTSRDGCSLTPAGIAIRSAGSVLVLVSSGYIIEGGGPLRRVIEARLHCQAINDDNRGEYALRYLKGKGMKLSKLAQKYGQRREVDALSAAAHADARLLSLLSDPNAVTGEGEVEEGEFSVLPFRDVGMAQSILYVVAYETVGVATTVVEAFGAALQIPPWISEELKRLGELADQISAASAG
jgi:hypothetical protein